MYLSRLILDPFNRQVQKDIGNVYEMHRSVMSAFKHLPEDQYKAGRVLYRLDKGRQGEIIIFVQSTYKADWQDKIFDDYFLNKEDYIKEYNPKPVKGNHYLFKLRANPTKKINYKRLGLFDEGKQTEWLSGKLSTSGATLSELMIKQEGFLKGSYMNKAGKKNTISFLSAVFEGSLVVNDPVSFVKALENGFGSAKGFGFGLMSIARG